MKTLDTDIKYGGYRLEQLFRCGMIAIYLKSKGRRWHYEVIRIQRHNGYSLHGINYPPSEFYPSVEQWDVHGFTCTGNYSQALAKAYEMVAADKKKEAAKAA